MLTTNLFAPELLKKYNTSGPRYTSYPTALEFTSDFKQLDLLSAIGNSTATGLSLYIHIPFCHSLCYYCGCNKIVTRQLDKAERYLDYLIREIETQSTLFSSYQIKQIHLGGGTPSFLTTDQMSRLITALRMAFTFDKKVEMSIEIDPREIELDYINHLADLGFNRLSIGVQDVDKKVQEAINRVQSTPFITQLIQRAKAVGMKSVNVDLIYGLPHQTASTFTKTLRAVKEMQADRISLFSYAHLPQRFAAQRKLKDAWLPNSELKFALMQQAIETLTEYGYELIGMDHFAKPDDELAIAQKSGTLHRNFQGYTTLADCDLLGLGVSSISAIGQSYSQNIKELNAYYRAIDEHDHALEKGILLSRDDMIRGDVIKSIMCNLWVDKQRINQEYAIDFDTYFAADIDSLTTFIDDELVCNTADYIEINPMARLLVRNIAMSFDAYMHKHLNQQRFSRVI